MIFSDAGPDHTTTAALAVEEAMIAHGIVKNPDKDVDDVLTATCVGIDLVDGRFWCPPVKRIWSLLDAVCDLAEHRTCYPGGVAGYLGVAQWFNLLRRMRLCVFDNVYTFCSGSLAKDWTACRVSDDIIGELLLDMSLSLFGRVDLQLPFLPLIGATDASTIFGLGGVVASSTIAEVRAIARMACKSGGHVSMSDGPEFDEALLARLGKRHEVPLELGDFDVIFPSELKLRSTSTLKKARQ